MLSRKYRKSRYQSTSVTNRGSLFSRLPEWLCVSKIIRTSHSSESYHAWVVATSVHKILQILGAAKWMRTAAYGILYTATTTTTPSLSRSWKWLYTLPVSLTMSYERCLKCMRRPKLQFEYVGPHVGKQTYCDATEDGNVTCLFATFANRGET